MWNSIDSRHSVKNHVSAFCQSVQSVYDPYGSAIKRSVSFTILFGKTAMLKLPRSTACEYGTPLHQTMIQLERSQPLPRRCCNSPHKDAAMLPGLSDPVQGCEGTVYQRKFSRQRQDARDEVEERFGRPYSEVQRTGGGIATANYHIGRTILAVCGVETMS